MPVVSRTSFVALPSRRFRRFQARAELTVPIIQIKTTMVNHRLNYGTSETARVRQAHSNPVNYCLDYRTSETLDPARSCEGPVSYYLVYGTYEARRYRSLAWPR